MDNSLKFVLVEDSRVADITDQETFAVEAGVNQNTFQSYSAISSSASNIIFQVQVPSENIALDRRVHIQSTITATLNYNIAGLGLGDGATIFNWGMSESWNYMPINSLISTCQATINNCSVSTNLKDILGPISRLTDSRHQSRENSGSCALPDATFSNYADCIGNNNNPMATFGNNSYDGDFVPRGAFPTSVVIYQQANGAGQFVRMPQQDQVGNITIDAATNFVNTANYAVVVTATFYEPFVCLSPFLNIGDNRAALIGINTISVNLNIDSSAARLLSSGLSVVNPATGALVPEYLTSVNLGCTLTGVPSVQPFVNTNLIMNYLTLQPTQYAKLSVKNVVPYIDVPRYLTLGATNQYILDGATTTITSNTIQMNQIPELIIIAIRTPIAEQTAVNPVCFFTVNNISINFNNSSGLLATATPYSLWETSVKNGSSLSWNEFQGLSRTGNINGDQLTVNAGTTGSLLVFKPAYDFSLPDFLSSSSLGQYQMQFNVNVTNNLGYSSKAEIVIITALSGCFITSNGTSQIFSGVLNKNDVLTTKEEYPVAHLDSQEYKRLIGGKMGNLGNGSLLKFIKHHKTVKSRNHTDGAGISGGGHSGGGISGGRRHKLSKFL